MTLGALARILVLLPSMSAACLLVDNPRLAEESTGSEDDSRGTTMAVPSPDTGDTSTAGPTTDVSTTTDATTTSEATTTTDATTTDGSGCGNDGVEAPEVCDGTDLDGQTCETQGYAGGGTLHCLTDCSGFSIDRCIGGDCCAAHATPGCNDPTCQAAVCAEDATCCDVVWDDMCRLQAEVEPACSSICGDVPCSDENIGSVTGPAAVIGNTATDDHDLTISCNAGGNWNDHVMTYVAPADGTYTFGPAGSSIMAGAIYLDCAFESTCVAGGVLQANLVAGQIILLVMERNGGGDATWDLDISFI